jgi:hypothetical protein
METPNINVREVVNAVLVSLREVSERWSSNIFVAFKLLGSIWLFSALVAMIVVLTEWFLEAFGVGTFVFTLIVTSFLLTVLTSATVRKPITTEEKKQNVLE